MSQMGIPVEITELDIKRAPSFGASLALCATAAGYSLDKESQLALKVDKAQFSRWKNDKEGILWPRLRELIDRCGNDAPFLWIGYQLGYDISSFKKRESELEQQLREAIERADKAENEIEVLRKYVGPLK